MSKIISRNFELRFVSDDKRANGETDFKGETSTLSTEDRIAFLNDYARAVNEEFKEVDLDKELVSVTEAKEYLGKIKPQPPFEKRIRFEFGRCKWTHRSSENTKNKVSFSCGDTKIPRQDFRSKLVWTFESCVGLESSEFALGEAVRFGVDECGILYYISDEQRIGIKKVPDRHDGLTFTVEADFVSGRFNLYLNDELLADFVKFSSSEEKFAEYITTRINENPKILSSVLGIGYYRLLDSDFEPFSIDTFLDEDFRKEVPFDGWTSPEYCDDDWNEEVLPIALGGERFAGENLYIRKKITIDDLKSQAFLNVESLTPGGEIYINSRLSAFITDESPKQIDVTKYLRPGENTFAILVYADKIDELDKMTHTHTDLYTGWFSGRISLDVLPDIYLKDVFTYTESISEDQKKAVQKIRVYVGAKRGMTSARATVHEIEAGLSKWFPVEEDRVICQKWSTRTYPNLTETSEAEITIEDPELWTADNPRLYKLTVVLKDEEGNVVDDFVSTFGIRIVSQEGGVFAINGRPELLRAPLLFGARPPLEKIAAWEKCPPAEYYVQEMLMLKAMNGNGFRMSVHDERIGGINDKRICEIADQMGVMLIWQTTTWLRITGATNLRLDELTACIRQVRNHPSIVIWQPMNHPSWKDWDYIMKVYRMLTDAIIPEDPSRLISPSADSRRMYPRSDDGLTDFEGNKCDSCDSAWFEKHICRGNMDYILGYGNEWSALREWPNVKKEHLPNWMDSTDYIPSYIDSPHRAYFNFEHDEIIGQPNWKIYQGKPAYHLYSYEKDYDEGSIGRTLSFDEWLTSQAWQALGAYETIVKCRWLNYDGLSWCNFRGGQNTTTYMKSIIDYYAQPKLSYYTHKMAFQNVLALSGNVDMVYGPDDEIPVIVLNIGSKKKVDVSIRVFDVNNPGVVAFETTIKDVVLQKGRSVSKITPLKLPKLKEGTYKITYVVSEKDAD